MKTIKDALSAISEWICGDTVKTILLSLLSGLVVTGLIGVLAWGYMVLVICIGKYYMLAIIITFTAVFLATALKGRRR